jgi:hypothetical protein
MGVKLTLMMLYSICPEGAKLTSPGQSPWERETICGLIALKGRHRIAPTTQNLAPARHFAPLALGPFAKLYLGALPQAFIGCPFGAFGLVKTLA